MCGATAATTTGDHLCQATDRDDGTTAATGTAVTIDDRAAGTTATNTASTVRLSTTSDAARVRLARQHCDCCVDRRCSTTTATVGSGESARPASATGSCDARAARAVGNGPAGERASRRLADVCGVGSRICFNNTRRLDERCQRKPDDDQRDRKHCAASTRVLTVQGFGTS